MNLSTRLFAASMSQARKAFLSALPFFRGSRSASFSTLRGPAASTPLRRLRPAVALLYPTGRAAFSTTAATEASLNGTSHQGGSITTTVSRCAPVMVEGRHVFQIAGYSLIRGLGVGKCIESNTFSVGGYDWRIQFYPDGKSNYDDDGDDYYSDSDDEDDSDDDDSEDEGYVSIFVVLASNDVNVRAFCELSLVDPGMTGVSPWVRSGKKAKVFDEEGAYWGFRKFGQRSDLESSEYLNDDCLKIQCDIKVITGMPVMESDAVSSDVHVPPSDLLEDVKKLLEEDKKADVTFMVKDEVFHAHKFVLAMRTPFFDAKLSNGAGGAGVSKKQYVTIEDMEPAVFKALLHFIYTDTLPAMDDLDGHEKEELVKSLLAAADRCFMERMKLMCASILCKGLKVENVATTLALAHQYSCSQLKDACIGFISSTDRLDDVVASAGYKQLKVASPACIVELWEKSAKSRN